MFKLLKSNRSYANVMKSLLATSVLLLGMALISEPSYAQSSGYKSDLKSDALSTSQTTEFPASSNNKSHYLVLAIDTANS